MKIATISKCHGGFLVTAGAALTEPYVFIDLVGAVNKIREIMDGPDQPLPLGRLTDAEIEEMLLDEGDKTNELL